ncbi:hypothetical protein Tco_1370945 [Tanacetum coccineum]
MSGKSSPLKRLIIEINACVKLPKEEKYFYPAMDFMQVTLLLLTAWRESHASRYDQVVPKQKYLRYCSEQVCLERSEKLASEGIFLEMQRFLRWVEAEMVSPEVESEKWRKLLLYSMSVAFYVSTDGREEDSSRNARNILKPFVASGEPPQALGVVRLSLAKNVAFNVLNEKTTFGLLKGLSNMYEKPSASKKVFLIKQLVNMKMTEGATVAGHVNVFNSVISKLLSVDIKFDDEMQALLLLSLLLDIWSGTVTIVSSTSGTNKLTFEGIRDMILGEDNRWRNSEEYLNSLLSVMGHGKKSNRGRSGSRKKLALENTTNITCWNSILRILGYGFGCLLHETPCVGMMKNFKPLLRKVCLADRKVLDVTSIGEVVLKTTFGTKVPYRLHDQMWKVTRGGQVIARGCKRGTLYMVEILVTEWSGGNLTKDVYKEAERKNAINERLCRKLGVRLRNKIRVKLYNRLHEQIYAPRAKLQEKSTREPLRFDLVSHDVLSNIVESLVTTKGSRTKGSVKASGSLGAIGSSVNRLLLYGRSSYARALIEVRADVELKDNIVDECPKNKVSDVVKNMKKPSQTPRGVPVGPKLGFQPTKQVYRHVSKKNNVSTSGNKKKYAEPTKESSSTSTTPIVEKINKVERLIIHGTAILVEDEGIPLKRVDSLGDHDSDDEVASVDNDMANFLLQRMLAMDIFDKIQDICDYLDIKVRGRNKK